MPSYLFIIIYYYFLGVEILGLFVLCLVIVICFAQGSLSATVISLFGLVSQNDSKVSEKLFHYCCLLIFFLREREREREIDSEDSSLSTYQDINQFLV